MEQSEKNIFLDIKKVNKTKKIDRKLKKVIYKEKTKSRVQQSRKEKEKRRTINNEENEAKNRHIFIFSEMIFKRTEGLIIIIINMNTNDNTYNKHCFKNS